MFKSELAAYAGVSTRTLRRWMVPWHEELEALGMTPRSQKLNPAVVKFLCEKLCIDLL